ncbi:MAG: hypothetical protein SNJ64_00985 [Endomicrobiia bacterium]
MKLNLYQKIRFILLNIIFLPAYLSSAGYIYTNAIGQKVYNNAISVSLGNNSTLINSLFVMKTNPSVLIDNEQLTSELNYGFYIVDERIIEDKQPLVKNDFNFFSNPDISIFYPVKIKNTSLKIGFGIGYFSEYENNYSYKVSTTIYTSVSNLDSFVIPILFGTNNFSIGFGIKNFLGGGSLQNNTQKTESTYSGSGFVLGTKLKLINTVIGLSFIPKNDVVVKSSLTGTEYKVNIPQNINIALKQEFGVDTGNPDSAFVEISFLNYGEVKVKDISSGYNDIMTLSLGLEKSFSEETVLRLGFFYEPNYIIRGCVKSGLGTGFGYNKNNLQFNIGLNYSKENYKGDGTIFSTKKVIDESYTNIIFGIKYKL